MAMKWRVVLCGILMLWLPGGYLLAAQHGEWTHVRSLYAPANGGGVFVSLGYGSMPGCYGESGAYIKNDVDTGAGRVYSLLMAAHMAQKEVRPVFEIVGDDPTRWGRCVIEGAYVR
jgi:hypothetical protein